MHRVVSPQNVAGAAVVKSRSSAARRCTTSSSTAAAVARLRCGNGVQLQLLPCGGDATRMAVSAWRTAADGVSLCADAGPLARFEVPAGWAADHDAASFQKTTYQRSDPVPSCGGRAVTGIALAADEDAFVVNLSPSTARITTPLATTTWATDAVRCRIPAAALLAAAASCAESSEARRVLASALEAISAMPRDERLSLGYTTFHGDVFRRCAAAAETTFSDAAYIGMGAFREEVEHAAPTMSAAEAAATPVRKSGTYAVPTSGSDEPRCSRRELLRSLSTDGFIVLQDAALRNGADPTLTEAAAAALSLGAMYEARAAPPSCPVERLTSRVTAMTALTASTFGVVRHTHYGAVATWGDEEISDKSGDATRGRGVEKPPAHRDTAYVRGGIGLHTDSTYFAEAPGIQIFGCVHRDPVTSAGGASEMVDGFAAAWDLYGEDRDLFAALTSMPVPATYVKEGRAFTAHRPVLSTRRGPRAAAVVVTPADVIQVSYNAYDRAPMPACIAASRSALEVERFYIGYTRFAQLCAARAQRFQLEVGDVLFFNNLRMLHARTAYSGPRIMAGAYVGADDVASAVVTELLTGQ